MLVLIVFFFFFSFFFLLSSFDHCMLPMLFENEIYLISLTLGLLCCALCRCQVETVVVGAIAVSPTFESCECMNIEGWVLRKTKGRLRVM